MTTIDRRGMLRGAALGGGALALGAWTPTWAQSAAPGLPPTMSGDAIELRIAALAKTVDGRTSRRIGINGTSPAPLLRLREGQRARIRVHNDLAVETSLHWHGLLGGGSGDLHIRYKWIAELTAAMVAVSRRQAEQATAREPQPGVQGQGGAGWRERREAAGRAGAAA